MKTVSLHLLRRTARTRAFHLNRQMLDQREAPRYTVRKSGRRLYRWKVVDREPAMPRRSFYANPN